MTALADVLTLMRQALDDTASVTFSDDELTMALRLALDDFSLAAPRRLTAVVAIIADGHAQDISSLGDDLMSLERIWVPYSGDAYVSLFDPGVRFEWLYAEKKVFVLGVEPRAGQDMKIIYYAKHTINGLQGAFETTLSSTQVTDVVDGATAWACVMKGMSSPGRLHVSGYTPVHWRVQGELRLKVWRERLAHWSRLHGYGHGGPVGTGI